MNDLKHSVRVNVKDHFGKFRFGECHSVINVCAREAVHKQIESVRQILALFHTHQIYRFSLISQTILNFVQFQVHFIRCVCFSLFICFVSDSLNISFASFFSVSFSFVSFSPSSVFH